MTDRKVLGSFRKLLPCLAAALGLALAVPDPTFAQATTGTLSGDAVDESGGVLPGATVEAVHGPTGTRYTAVTDAGGRFSIINVRVGGRTR